MSRDDQLEWEQLAMRLGSPPPGIECRLHGQVYYRRMEAVRDEDGQMVL